jgi:hypothetical protein
LGLIFGLSRRKAIDDFICKTIHLLGVDRADIWLPDDRLVCRALQAIQQQRSLGGSQRGLGLPGERRARCVRARSG